MAEDDEIDILGDYSFDLLSKNETFDGTPLVSQNSDLLNCEYTVHPQWLLDKPSANPALWYTNATTSNLDTKQFEDDIQSEAPIITTQQNSITDESGWTDKEKDLLHRGIDIFGKSNVNLSQFIGSRTPAEVKYFLKNFYSEQVQLSYTSVNEDILFDENCIEERIISSEPELLQDNEIPASIEEIIDSVPKKNITPRKRTNSNRKSDKAENVANYHNVPCGQSLLKSSYVTVEHKGVLRKQISANKVKFKTKLKIPTNKSIRPQSDVSKKTKHKLVKPLRQLIEQSKDGPAVKKDLRIITGNGIGVTVCEGEEVVKIIKKADDSESDIDIDIEDDDPIKNKIHHNDQTKMSESATVKGETRKNSLNLKEDNAELSCKILPKKSPQLEDLDDNIVKELLSLEYPICEVLLDRNEITDVEKFLFYEFFEGRPTKTPDRYLLIRNHILDAWKMSKPNYVRKTTIRNGLKQAGDVNLIGKIHSFLEQNGSINFGCEQTNYSRPLLDLATVSSIPKEKAITKYDTSLPRQRVKKKFNNDGEGGYTLVHDERGEIINTTIVNEEPIVKQRTYLKKPSVRLIYCRPFTDEYPQKYSISLDITTLILMDLHAHMYLTEVMGLIGGNWNADANHLLIKRYIPCRNIASSLTHCDMCPISQAKAVERLHDENLDVLGWYHSHPTFAPEPSQQDIDTQLSVQKWMGSKFPCLGFILSPFSLHGALIASPIRCMIVNKREDHFVPYKFKVDLLSDQLSIHSLLSEARWLVSHENAIHNTGKNRINFQQAYFQDNTITYLDKYIYSVKMHLAKCSNINKMTCDAIVDKLTEVCNSATT